MSDYEKPLPVVTPWSKPFWDAARERRLVVQYCPDCDQAVFYPKLFCPFCYGRGLQWKEIRGEGEVYSYAVMQRHPPSAFRDSLPYVIAIVRLAGGVQMMTNIVGCEPEDVHCGMQVVPEFDDVTDHFTLVKFRPAK